MNNFNNKIIEIEIKNKLLLLEIKNIKELLNSLIYQNNNLKFRIIDLEKIINDLKIYELFSLMPKKIIKNENIKIDEIDNEIQLEEKVDEIKDKLLEEMAQVNKIEEKVDKIEEKVDKIEENAKVDKIEEKAKVDKIKDKILLEEVLDDDDKSIKNNFNKTKKIVRKAGRTLLIKVYNEISTFNNDLIFNLDGLLKQIFQIIKLCF